MCGIAGYCGRFGPELLARMSAAVAHRGPDGAGSYISSDGGTGLAHRRLAIIDLSPTGAQPMTDAATGVTITYNGEIYNYRELRAQLEAAGAAFVGRSDTEVILRLYLAHGRAALPCVGLVEHGAGWWIEIGVDPLGAALEEALALSSTARAGGSRSAWIPWWPRWKRRLPCRTSGLPRWVPVGENGWRATFPGRASVGRWRPSIAG